MGQFDLLGGFFAVPLHGADHELVRHQAFLPATGTEREGKSFATHRFSGKLGEPLLV